MLKKKQQKVRKQRDWKRFLVIIATIKAITSVITEIIKAIKSL